MGKISRRRFLSIAGTTLAGTLLAGTGCSLPATENQPVTTPSSLSPTLIPTSSEGSPTPSELPPTVTPEQPTPTPEMTGTPVIEWTSTPAATQAPDILLRYPAAPSKVVVAHHSGIWSGGSLVDGAITQLLDSSITRLTAINDATDAWKVLFKPEEKIAIKVNTIAGSSLHTHVQLVNTVVQKLITAGIPANQIFVYDRAAWELEGAGFQLSNDGSSFYCLGTESNYNTGWNVMDRSVGLSQILVDCNALINIPVLKQHGIAGVSFAMKNHYGTVDQPASFHSGNYLKKGLAELNALEPIQARTRLVIGDAFELIPSDNWSNKVAGDALIVSYDPVASDTIALNRLVEYKKQAGENTQAVQSKAEPWLAHAAELDLGTNQIENMKIEEFTLS